MKQYKTELEEENSAESSNFNHTRNLLVIESSKKPKLNYIGFFVVYFTLSSITSYLTVYLPVYLLSILNVNRTELAFIQFFSFSVLFVAPGLGFLFDKFNHCKKEILLFSFFLFLFSFIATVFSGKILNFFGTFLALNLLSNEIIKVGMSKILLDSAINERIKDKNLTIINVSANFGGFIPSIVFMFIVTDIYIFSLWTYFFLIGGISIIPIFFAMYCFDFKAISLEKNTLPEISYNSSKKNYFQILLLTISFILVWSDKLYQYPFPSWILSKYGQSGLMLYSFSYIFFLLLNALGCIMGQKLPHYFIKKKKKGKKNISNIDIKNNESKKSIKNIRKNIIIFSNVSYIFLTFFLILFSNLIYLLLIYGLIWFIAGIMMLNYVSLSISISKRVKYQTFSYQMLRLGLAIASVIFIPIGTFLSAFLTTELLILIVGFLSILSLIPLYFL